MPDERFARRAIVRISRPSVAPSPVAQLARSREDALESVWLCFRGGAVMVPCPGSVRPVVLMNTRLLDGLSDGRRLDGNAVVPASGLELAVVGQDRCPIIDTWWQTETGGFLISPIAGISPLKGPRHGGQRHEAE